MRKPYTIGPSDSVQEPLRFRARSLIIDNQGGQWVTEVRGGQQVAPWTSQAVLAVDTDLAWLSGSAPPAGQQSTGAGDAATVIYTDELLTPSPGVQVAPALSPSFGGNAVYLGLNSTGPAAASLTATFSFPLTALLTGQQYRLASVQLGVGPNGAALPTTMRVFGYAVTLSGVGGQGPITGVGWLASAQVPPFNVFRRPEVPYQFTKLAGTQLVITAVAMDGTTFALGQLQTQGAAELVPVVL